MNTMNLKHTVEVDIWEGENYGFRTDYTRQLSVHIYDRRPTTTKVGRWEHSHARFYIRLDTPVKFLTRAKKPFLTLSGHHGRYNSSHIQYEGRAWNLKDAVKLLLKKRIIPSELVEDFKLILEDL